MSATVNQDLFSAYYNAAPCITIPGQAFEVQDLYLEDFIRQTQFYATAVKGSRTFTAEENASMTQNFRQQGLEYPQLVSTLSMLTRSERYNAELVGETVSYLLSRSARKGGSILVFAPGVRTLEIVAYQADSISGGRNQRMY